MGESIAFFVPGDPKTKGSLQPRQRRCRCTPNCPGYLGKAQLRDSEGSTRWRKLVAYVVGREMRDRASEFPWSGSLLVELAFSLKVEDAAGGETRAHVGDLDKLIRNVLDALQDAGLYLDDVQVVEIFSSKRAVSGNPGVWIKVAHAG
jgi:Holliday junction resolvase RusA-like endonuclease